MTSAPAAAIPATVTALDAPPDAVASPTRRSRTRRRRSGTRALGTALAGSALAGALFAGSGALGAAPAGAREEPVTERVLQLCDPTGCLIAWRVVDSDRDGVSDADELVAGTDPHDARSVPGLRVLTGLLEDRRLPSFEDGFAAFVVMPDDLVTMREEASDPGRLDGLFLEGFPIEGRKDRLSRLGISAEQMARAGVDPFRSGFTIGLQPPTKGEAIPGLRLGSMDRSLISAGDDGLDELEPLTPLDNGGIVWKGDVDGDFVVLYKDDSAAVIFKDGSGAWVDPSGKVTLYPKGSFYTNPDADQPTEVTEEQLEQFERVRGATARTIEGWKTPGADDTFDPTSPTVLIAIYDTELGSATGITTDVPRVTSAQPDVRPDLPNPLHGVPAGGFPGGKGGDCPTEGRC